MQNAPRELSAILSTFIKLPFVLKTFVLSILEWPLKTGFTVYRLMACRRKGKPKLTWKKLMVKDCREWKLTTVDPQERSTWRSGVRSAMLAASQLPGRGPTDVDVDPAPAC